MKSVTDRIRSSLGEDENCLSPESRGLLQKPPVAELHKNFPKMYGIRRLIPVFTSSLYWSPS
jgi:hypothetical protein